MQLFLLFQMQHVPVSATQTEHFLKGTRYNNNVTISTSSNDNLN